MPPTIDTPDIHDDEDGAPPSRGNDQGVLLIAWALGGVALVELALLLWLRWD